MRCQKTPATLVICDDHRLVAEGLRRLLCSRYAVLGVVFSAGELLRALRANAPDCLLLDLQLPDRHGLFLIPEVLQAQPAIRIVVVTMFIDRELAMAAMAAGAHGFVPKDAAESELVAAVEDVLAGRYHVSRRVPKATHRSGLNAVHPALGNLTPRQHDILMRIGEGKSEARVSTELAVSRSTVTFHKRNIMRVLGVTEDAELLSLAVLLRTAARGTTELAPSGEVSDAGYNAV